MSKKKKGQKERIKKSERVEESKAKKKRE